MAITVEPQSSITLIKCKLESDYKHTFTFNNLNAQTTYFNGITAKKVIGTNNYAYVRKDNSLDVDEPIDTLMDYNYLFYNNAGFTTKRYYCFIDRLEYINENCTRIYFHTDVFQTWYFQLAWNKCWVEREHVNNDSFGANTVPENVELGEYISNGVENVWPLSSTSSTMYIGIACSQVPDDVQTALGVNPFNVEYDGVYCGTPVILADSALAATNYIRILDSLGKGDAIVSIYMIPRSVLHATPTFVNVTINNITAHVASIATSSSAEDMGLYESTVNTSLNGYTPVNKKLLTWPYNYAYVTNNVGQNMELHYEDFYFGELNTQLYYYIRTVGSLTPGCSIRCFPIDYKKKSDSTGTAYSYDHGITLGKFPICSWNTDTYTNWLTSQGANIGVGFAGSVASLAIGSGMILTGGGAGIGMGMAMAGIGGIASSIASVYSHSLVPHKEGGNTNSGDVTYSKGELKFVIHKMCIRPEYARIIDEYFSAYGYKVNRLKIPNVAGRLNWNFVKTIGCNVDGDVPQEDLLAIRKACDDGITFWHTPANIYNYSLSNTIVS